VRLDELLPDDLGPCCACKRGGARNLLMLDRKAPVPGTGWGCVICDLPSDGAVAVMCDECLGLVPLEVCQGFAMTRARAPFSSLSADWFGHDESKHPEEAR
jgi:hypothetical protein